MPVPKGFQFKDRQVFTDEQMIEEIPKIGLRAFAKKHGVSVTSVNRRRRTVEERVGGAITPLTRGGHWQQLDRHPASRQVDIINGCVLIGSDAHYHPGLVTTAHRAFVEFAKEYKPKLIVANGDIMDFPSISRFGMIGWEDRPKVIDEIENAKAMLSEIEKASPNSRRTWNLGNHDGRFETKLASVAPEYAKVHGMHLKDSFEAWEPCWATFINEDIVVKHRFKSGLHAPHNNTLWAGKSIVTGHLHSLKVMPISDYRGVRYGVDSGCMMDPYGPQAYQYCELSPVNWRSGFVLLTIQGGRLLWPEVIHVCGPNEIEFRGKAWSV